MSDPEIQALRFILENMPEDPTRLTKMQLEFKLKVARARIAALVKRASSQETAHDD